MNCFTEKEGKSLNSGKSPYIAVVSGTIELELAIAEVVDLVRR